MISLSMSMGLLTMFRLKLLMGQSVLSDFRVWVLY